MSLGTTADWPEDLFSYAGVGADTAQPVEVRCQSLRALAAAANDSARPKETRDRVLSLLAEIAGDEHQPQEIREEAFTGLMPAIAETAGVVAVPFTGQPGRDLLQEAPSYIWERLPQFRPGRFQSWCHKVLKHLILDRLRRRKTDLTAQAAPLPLEEEEAGETLATLLAEITEQVTAQVKAIRLVFPASQPGGAVLLLNERLWLGQAIVTAYASEDGRTADNQIVCERVESMASWETDDEARLLPREISLTQAWQLIRERTQDRPQEATPALVAEILGDRAGNWNQWVCRARSCLARRLGASAARRLFPYWPAGVFERAAGGTEP